jgi:hypothetical protein
MNDDFIKDLNFGLEYEKKAQELIIKKFNKTVIKECHDYKYDFKTDDGIKYEVKTDLMSKKTNNFFIEILSHRQPSGIQTTHADFYIITDTDKFYLIDINLLKKLLHELGENKKLVYNKNKTSLGYIINKYLIINLSITL